MMMLLTGPLSIFVQLRTLDSVLGALAKAGETFDVQRIPFVLEAW